MHGWTSVRQATVRPTVGEGFSMELKPGDIAPDFTLPMHTGGTFTLSEHADSGLVLFAYPEAGTPGCSLELHEFVRASAHFTAAGYQLVGVSPDSVERNGEFAADMGATFPLLSDPERTMLVDWDIWGDKVVFGHSVTTVRRSTFVLDPGRVVRHAWYNVKATGHVARVLRELGIDTSPGV